jgi:Zn-dependent protease with chaperone function
MVLENPSELAARPSLAVWAALAMALVAFSYVFTLLLAAACVYLPFLLLSAYAGFHTLAVFVCGVVMSIVMLWSLVPRRDKFSAPGPRLHASEHPRLFSELEGIAKTLDEPMPSEVYLIADLNAWVAERGGVMGFGSRRVMGLGLPLVRILTISQFRAVLAHEFGHFYTGDTRLLPWVHKTREAMVRTLNNLGSESLAEVFAKVQLARLVHHLAVAALVGYWKLFMRITQAISRRQEYRADELASYVAGPHALIEGLRAIHGASAALPSFWQTELVPAIEAGCRPSIADGFAYFIAVPGIAEAISGHVEKELREATTGPYDTHPPLRDRIAAVGRLALGRQEPDGTLAIALLDGVDGMELQLLEAIDPDRNVSSLRSVAWERVGTEIYVPAWRDLARGYASLLADYTVERLPEAVAKLDEIARRMRDPQGMLLTRQQRVERAAQLLWRALAVTLWDDGWQLHAEPGEFHVERQEYRIAPSVIVAEMRSGAITAIEWSQRCKAAAISALPLTPSAP